MLAEIAAFYGFQFTDFFSTTLGLRMGALRICFLTLNTVVLLKSHKGHLNTQHHPYLFIKNAFVVMCRPNEVPVKAMLWVIAVSVKVC